MDDELVISVREVTYLIALTAMLTPTSVEQIKDMRVKATVLKMRAACEKDWQDVISTPNWRIG